MIPFLVLLLMLVPFAAAWGENVAPGAHWGAMDFPYQSRTLLMGYTINRFTEFNAHRDRFNAINQTAGFNFATISWTDRLDAFPGWSGNLTIGGGPTSESPSRNAQDAFHRATDQGRIPAADTRNGGDFMAGGSATRWSRLFTSRDIGFVGLGATSGSLYHEVYGKIGVRRASLADVAGWVAPQSNREVWNQISKFVRFSVMGRVSRVFGGSAYSSDNLANDSSIGQAAVSFADYETTDGRLPKWELEVALTYDSGLFASRSGDSIVRRFGSVALRFPYGTIETWNDFVGSTDIGPTFGASFMLNLLELYPALSGRH